MTHRADLWADYMDVILVWSWSNTPEWVVEYIQNRDDISWVAFAPKCYADEYIPWLECDSFGCCDTEIIQIGPHRLYIGYHS